MEKSEVEIPVSPEMTRNATVALARVRIRAINEYPFHGALGMGLAVVVCTHARGVKVETAATDGKYLFVNPFYFMSLSENERLSIYIHEVMHVALAHHLRRGRREQVKWNHSTDYAVNSLIKETGLPLGEGWLYEHKYRGWSAERIHGSIEDPTEQPPPPVNPEGGGDESQGEGGGDQGDDTDPRQPGEVWDAVNESGGKLTPEEINRAMGDLSRDLSNANDISKQAGNATGALHERAVDEVMSPSAGWDSLLQDFWSGSGDPLNETWRRPNRRYIPAGIWAPSTDEYGLDWAVIGVDVSGSIMQDECNAFISQINMMKSEVPAKRITLVPFNSVIQSRDIVEIYEGDEVPSKFRVGGGTNFSSITNWVRSQEECPDFLIIFTDLGDERYGEEPECPVLWASSYPVYENNGYTNRPPYGDVIEVEASVQGGNI